MFNRFDVSQSNDTINYNISQLINAVNYVTSFCLHKLRLHRISFCKKNIESKYLKRCFDVRKDKSKITIGDL